MSFSRKLLLSFLIFGLIILCLTSTSHFFSTKKRLTKDAIDRLSAIRDNHAKIIEYYFAQKSTQVQLLAQSQEIANALDDFKKGFNSLPSEINLTPSIQKELTESLKTYYEYYNNYHPLHNSSIIPGSSSEITPPSSLAGSILQYNYIARQKNNNSSTLPHQAFEATSYRRYHEKHDENIKKLITRHGFYDILLIDPQTGDIIYTVLKELDIGANLFNGPYQDSNLANITLKANKNSSKNFVEFIDFEHYAPSRDLPSCFFTTSVFRGSEKIGIIAVQLSVDELDDVLTDQRQWEASGLGKTGETYLVGPDYMMRNNSRFLLENPEKYFQSLNSVAYDKNLVAAIRAEKTTILLQRVQTAQAARAFAGYSGTMINNDYRGISVLSSFRPLRIANVSWVILAEMDASEIFQDIEKFKIHLFFIFLVFLTFILILSFFLAKTFSGPINVLTREIQRFGPETLDHRIKLETKDEFEKLADSFNQMAKQLQQKTVSLDYFDMVISSMTDILLVINIDRQSAKTIIQDANPAACRILGYERDEIIGLEYRRIFADSQEADMFDGENLQQLLNSAVVRGLEITYSAKNGREIPVLFSISPMPKNTSKSRGYVTIAQEISDLKMARGKMKEQINLLTLSSRMGRTLTRESTLTKQFHKCCLLLTEHLNTAAVQIWLLNEKDNKLSIISEASSSIAADESRDISLDDKNDIFVSIALDHKPVTIEEPGAGHRVFSKLEWIKQQDVKSFAGIPLLVGGKTNGVIGLFFPKPLTEIILKTVMLIADELALAIEHYRQAKALNEEKERFKALTENISDWIWEFDENEIFTYSSPRVTDLLGYTPEEVVGRSAFDFIPPDEARQVAEEFNAIKRARRSFFTLKNINLHKNGNLVPIESSGVPIFDADGNYRGYRGIDRDITERKKTEEQLRQAQKMEAIGTLAGGIAHDFNNILTPIFSYTELTRESLPPGTPAHQQLGEVLKASLRAKDLVRQILTFSRKNEPEKSRIQFQTIIKEALQLLRASLPASIEIEQEISATPGPIFANSSQLHQIVMNLATNSFHAMKEQGGILKIKLAGIALNGDEPGLNSPAPGEYIRLVISDTGRGMDTQTKARIFEPYFTTKKMGEGTGLGLAVVHGIVSDLNGRITVDSQLGRGTSFCIYLPIINDKQNSKQGNRGATKLSLQGHGTIMLVDDEEQILNSMKLSLQKYGYQVDSFISGGQAFSAFQEQPGRYDLIITDMNMPKMDGLELAKKIFRIEKDIPVVLYTGYEDEALERKAKQEGIREIIIKPVTTDELINLINSLSANP